MILTQQTDFRNTNSCFGVICHICCATNASSHHQHTHMRQHWDGVLVELGCDLYIRFEQTHDLQYFDDLVLNMCKTLMESC
jgi:hypothetical protein